MTTESTKSRPKGRVIHYAKRGGKNNLIDISIRHQEQEFRQNMRLHSKITFRSPTHMLERTVQNMPAFKKWKYWDFGCMLDSLGLSNYNVTDVKFY